MSYASHLTASRRFSVLTRFLILSTSILILASGSAFACTEDGKEGILPENDLKIPVGYKSARITEEQFNQVIDEIESVMRHWIAAKGGTLNVLRRWSDPTVNAFARRERDNPKIWTVAMFGGLARHETMTLDGFAAVMCHEVGHHIGGAPRKPPLVGNAWASNEGQSDYFATLKCLRAVYGTAEQMRAWVRPANVPQELTAACRGSYRTRADVRLCERTALAGQALGNLFAKLRNLDPPSFDTPDTRRVSSTDHDHPLPQCRLDTYFAGSLCTKDVSEDVGNDVTQGTCSTERGDTVGVRPLCWYKPQT